MPNAINVAISNEYEELLGGDGDLLFVQPIGMEVGSSNALRARLGAAHLRMRLVKGSLARRVLEARGLSGFDAIFTGPAAVIVPEAGAASDAAAVTAAKLIGSWRKETGSELPAIKGGVMEGAVLGEAQARALQKLPGKEELRATIVAQILAPGRRLASQLRAPGARIAGALATHIENQEKAG